MSLDWGMIFENSVYLLALLNPVSKLFFLATYEPKLNGQQIFDMAWRSSAVALGILIAFAFAGQFVLQYIFRIEMYSLKITGGLVLFFIGWLAVREGRFFQKNEHNIKLSLNDISIVPLAAPLIAGPGAMTIAIAIALEFGHLSATLSLFFAIFANFIIMLFSLPINRLLQFMHLTGPLIRITGLIVAAVSVQMVLAGFSEWLKTI